MKHRMKFLLPALLFTCTPTVSLAHSVYIFAWVDGAQICTESYFTQKNKVRGGEVMMTASSGDILDQGMSGDDGTLCFPLPDKAQPLEFIVLAGAGHRGTYHVGENELVDAIKARDTMPAQAAAVADPFAGTNSLALPDKLSPASYGQPQINNEDEAVLRRIVREELQNQLSPMRQYMAEKLEDKTPGVKEIIGGIGWLVGLGGLGLWWSQRKKKQ